jgi:CheY-like chemotaxis protein
MPEMGGEAFIRARIGDDAVVRVPVIAVTGDGLPPDRGTELGIREVIRKPADPVAVFAAVQRHCPHAASAG